MVNRYNSLEDITWSVMGQQTAQTKKIYLKKFDTKNEKKKKTNYTSFTVEITLTNATDIENKTETINVNNFHSNCLAHKLFISFCSMPECPCENNNTLYNLNETASH